MNKRVLPGCLLLFLSCVSVLIFTNVNFSPPPTPSTTTTATTPTLTIPVSAQQQQHHYHQKKQHESSSERETSTGALAGGMFENAATNAMSSLVGGLSSMVSSPSSTVSSPLSQEYIELQWVDGFPRDCYSNSSTGHQCQADVTVSLMIAESYTLSENSVALFGMWGKRKRQFGDPIVLCATEHNETEWVRAAVYIIRFFDPFNWFEAICTWKAPYFASPNSKTYITIKGSAVIKKILVRGYEEYTKPDSGIAICVSQFHNYISERLLVEFVEYYRLLGATTFYIYDFDNRFHILKLVRQYELLTDVKIILINWSPVQRYPSYCRGQVLALNDCFMRARRTSKYLLQIDLDEFLFSSSYAAVSPTGSLTDATEHWEKESAGKPFVVIFPRYDFQSVCGKTTQSNPYYLALPQFTIRCELPSAYLEMRRSEWKTIVQGGFSWGGFPKYMVSTDYNFYCGSHRCGGLHVHTVQEARREYMLRFLPELDEWRINHYRGWTVDGYCKESPPSTKRCLVFVWHKFHRNGSGELTTTSYASAPPPAPLSGEEGVESTAPHSSRRSERPELCSLAPNQLKHVKVRTDEAMWICYKRWSSWVVDNSMESMTPYLTGAIHEVPLLHQLFSNNNTIVLPSMMKKRRKQKQQQQHSQSSS